jgi:hypothetical protein
MTKFRVLKIVSIVVSILGWLLIVIGLILMVGSYFAFSSRSVNYTTSGGENSATTEPPARSTAP